jgi:hypothetical protein
MRKLTTILAAAAAPLALGGVLLATAGQASAAVVPAENISFFSGGNGNAHWLPQQSGVILTAPDNSSYAGFDVHHRAASLPAAKPSFTYTETGSPSGGAPRLVFTMSNGDQVMEYAAAPAADGTTVNTASQFDVYGGPSGYQYNASWATITGQLEKGQHITSEQVVSDTYTGPTSVTITSLNDGTAQLIG